MNDASKIRINKYLAERQICSRREADVLIKAGLVFINGSRAELGDKVASDDKVKVKGTSASGSGKTKNLVYIAYNKPIGIVTHSKRENEEDILSIIDIEPEINRELFPVGRLDKASHGLIILTNDGRVTNPLLNPEAKHEKEYLIKTAEPLKDRHIRKLGSGVNIEGYMTKPARVKQMGQSQFSIIISEGKRHQIRRMCAAMGLTVIDLERTRIMNIRLGKLKEGQYRYIEGGELSKFLSSLELK